MNLRTVQYGALALSALIIVITVILLANGVRGTLIMGGLGLLLTIYGYVSYYIVSVHIEYSTETPRNS